MKPIFFRMLMIFLFLNTAMQLTAHKREKIKPGYCSNYFFSSCNKTPMPPSPFGIIYSKNNWSNTNDFVTRGNTTAVLSGGYVNISSSSYDDWNNIVNITGYQTKLEKWKFKLRFKIIAWSGNSYGLGFGLKSANANVQNDIMGFLQTSNTGNGGLYIVRSGRTVVASGLNPLGVALNDVIDMEGEFYDSVFHFTAHNITSNAMTEVSFTFATNGSTYVVPNTSVFSFMELGGTHQIQNIEISSEELTGANIVTIGDSKTIGYFSNTFSGRYAAQLNNIYSPVVINAGGADGVSNVLNRQEELIRLAPDKYLLCIGSNDLRFGSTLAGLQTSYDSLVRLLLATGATVYHFVLPEDYTKSLGVNMVQFKDWVAATYAPGYINVWDSMVNGNLLKGIYDTGDGVHINQAGNDKIYEAIVASNKLNGGTLAVRLYSFEAFKINRHRAYLGWRLDPFHQAEKYDLMKSTDGNHFSNMTSVSSNADAIYSCTDNNLQPGINYYKLSMIESTGDTVYSKLVTVKNNHPGFQFNGLQKVNDYEYVFYITSPEAAAANWQIVDASGRKLLLGYKQLYSGSNSIRISIPDYPGGIYYFGLQTAVNGDIVTCRFIK